jgi:hypothetical protein
VLKKIEKIEKIEKNEYWRFLCDRMCIKDWQCGKSVEKCNYTGKTMTWTITREVEGKRNGGGLDFELCQEKIIHSVQHSIITHHIITYIITGAFAWKCNELSVLDFELTKIGWFGFWALSRKDHSLCTAFDHHTSYYYFHYHRCIFVKT